MIMSSSSSVEYYVSLILSVDVLLVSLSGVLAMVAGSDGSWEMLTSSIGISSMHSQLLHNDRVITFDSTDAGPSNLTFPDGGECPIISGKPDCYVHSVELSDLVKSNVGVRPLTLRSDTWCSSGAISPNGTLLQTGGNGHGGKVVRTLDPCPTCNWNEYPHGLIHPRWYASNQVLPAGNMIVVGGLSVFSYEFVPKTSQDQNVYMLPFLEETRYSVQVPNNLYPFTHLSPDGNLFIFANNRAVLLDYRNNQVVRTYPVMPGNVARNYPSTGSSVLLPLDLSTSTRGGATPKAEVLICGGTQPDAFDRAAAGVFVEATKCCGRLRITAANPKWEMEEMPLPRLMGDMLLLPTGDVLIINGAANGSAGWGYGRVPVLNPVMYRPAASAARFEVLRAGTTPRLYHSTAILLTDGRVLVAGSNPNSKYNFTAPFPTETSAEAFSPPYLTSDKPRPSISAIKPGMNIAYRQMFTVEFQLKVSRGLGKVYLTMEAPSFTTHSFSMNQRLLVLEITRLRRMSSENYVVDVNAPGSAASAPPGYYLLFVVHDGVPSIGKWLHIE